MHSRLQPKKAARTSLRTTSAFEGCALPALGASKVETYIYPTEIQATNLCFRRHRRDNEANRQCLGAGMSDITEQIRKEIREWQKQSGVRVPEQVQQILVAAVSAIVYDPHPGWRLPTGMEPWPSKDEGLREIQQDAIKKIPDILVDLAKASPGEAGINTFTLLHSGPNMLEKLCPFDKGH